MRSKRIVLVGFVALVIAYLAAYLVWSRCYAWDGGKLWAFNRPPAGLKNPDLPARYRWFGATAWEGWQRVESVPGIIFSPCILIDDWLAGRAYLPTYRGTVCFN